MRTQVKLAFTLIEILIVVVILGILAAIVIPQFTDASQQANNSNVVSQLQTLRGQIELFRVRNAGVDPTIAADGDWTSMLNPVGGEAPYLQGPPRNPLMPAPTAAVPDSQTSVGTAADGSTAWVFMGSLNGGAVNQIYAWDPINNMVFDEDGDGDAG